MREKEKKNLVKIVIHFFVTVNVTLIFVNMKFNNMLIKPL